MSRGYKIRLISVLGVIGVDIAGIIIISMLISTRDHLRMQAANKFTESIKTARLNDQHHLTNVS